MSEDFIVHGEFREEQGTGASRRLRRTGKVPAILYGGGMDPRMLSLKHNEVIKHLETEAFYSHILTIQVGDEQQQAVLKDVQRHPAKAQILHMDFMRVMAGHEITMHVPLHFINQDKCIGVKQSGGMVEHLANDLEIVCLPKNLPEFIEVDVANLDIGDVIHLSEITLPEGVEPTALRHGDDPVLASVHKPRAAVEDDAEGDDAAEGESAEGDEAKED